MGHTCAETAVALCSSRNEPIGVVIDVADSLTSYLPLLTAGAISAPSQPNLILLASEANLIHSRRVLRMVAAPMQLFIEDF